MRVFISIVASFALLGPAVALACPGHDHGEGHACACQHGKHEKEKGEKTCCAKKAGGEACACKKGEGHAKGDQEGEGCGCGCGCAHEA